MIDYALTLTAIAIFISTRQKDSLIVACAFVAVLSVFELFEVSQAYYDLAGAHCFALMASVWLAASVYTRGRRLSCGLVSMALFVGACGVVDALMPLGSVSASILFQLYPYAMIATQIIVLILAGQNGINPLHINSCSLYKSSGDSSTSSEALVSK